MIPMIPRARKWTPNTQKSLTVVSLLLLAEFVVGTLVAIQRNLPAELGGKSGKTAAEEYLTKGTAISPPIVFCFVLAAFIICLSLPKPRWLSTLGAAGLLLVGVVGLITGLAEPIVYRIFSPATLDFPLALLEAAGFLLIFLTIAFAVRSLARRMQERKPRRPQSSDEAPIQRSSKPSV